MPVSVPGKIIMAAAYVEGDLFDACAEITLPDIMMLVEDVDSMGSNGPTEMILPKLDKMEVEIRCTAPSLRMAQKFTPFNDVVVDGRGSWQAELAAGGSGTKYDRVNMVVRPKGLGFGAQSNADGGERTFTCVVHAVTYYVEDTEILHWAGYGKNEFRINGVDVMAQHRANVGQ